MTAEGDTIDLIAWRAYGDGAGLAGGGLADAGLAGAGVAGAGVAGGEAPPAGSVEALYAANPGLSRRSLSLPAGLTVQVPSGRPWPARPPVRLWD